MKIFLLFIRKLDHETKIVEELKITSSQNIQKDREIKELILEISAKQAEIDALILIRQEEKKQKSNCFFLLCLVRQEETK